MDTNFPFIYTPSCSLTEAGGLAMLGYSASFPHSSPQHEVIFKSCKDVMPLLSYLSFKDASFRVLKYTVTIGAHMQDSRDCPMSLLIE